MAVRPSYEGDQDITLNSAASVRIHFGAPKDSLDVLSLDLPAEYALTVPPHFHPKSTEFMRVLEGELIGTVNGEAIVMRAGDPWREIPPGTRHTVTNVGGKEGKRTVWLERSGPNPEQKKRFFEDFIGPGKLPGFVGTMATFYRDGDTIPALPGGPYTDIFAYALVYLVGGFAHHTGLAVPYRFEGKVNVQANGHLAAS